MKIAFAIVVLCAAFMAATATPHFAEDTLDFPSVPAGEFYDLDITNTDGSVPMGCPVECGHTAVNTAGTIFTAFMSDTNVITVRMFNLGTSATNPPSQTFKCAMNYYDE
jgi:hypothetical protein